MFVFPFAGVVFKGGSANQFAMSLTTTALKMAAWANANGAAAQSSSFLTDGDPAVQADAANNRILLETPGIYLVTFNVSGVGGGTADTLWQGRINGGAITDMSCEMGASTARSNAGFEAIINVTRSQVPTTGIGTFGAPAGTYTGGAGAPQTMTTLDIVGSTLSGSVTFNVEFSNLTVVRLGKTN